VILVLSGLADVHVLGSWSNEIAPWQWYIHGPGATSEYLAVSSSYKNPADTSEAQGVKTTIDGTSFWNGRSIEVHRWTIRLTRISGQTMERTEIIPQTSANLGTGHLYYHFSLMTSSTNPPNAGYEHQIAFFEVKVARLPYAPALPDARGALSLCRATSPRSSTGSSPASPARPTTPSAGTSTRRRSGRRRSSRTSG
jgi:hypothetical protein